MLTCLDHVCNGLGLCICLGYCWIW